MAPKKQKGLRMNITDFFAETSSGSWADEVVIPTAPSAKDPDAGPRRGEPGYLDSMPDRGARSSFPGGPPSREDLPIPTVPPFTAFIGNLVYEVDEDALREFFADLNPTSVRLVKDPMTSKPKGFGYVEFGSQDELKQALDRSNSQMMGRSIRISVADAPSTSRRDGFPGSVADGADQWRRTTPLAPRADAAVPPARRQTSFNDRPEREGGGGDLDWGAARGTRFTPSAPHSPSGLRRDSSGPPRERDLGRDMGPSVADGVDQWRSSRPMAEPNLISREGSFRGGPRTEEGSPSLAETETTWSRGTKMRTPVTDDGPRSPGGGDDKEWRSSRATSAQPSTDGGSPRAPPQPLERRKLNLAPRSVPPTPTSAKATDSSNDTRGIFGSAKPIDSATKEREAEEKLAHKDEERKKAREEEIKRQREEEEKGRQLQEEKYRKMKEETAKATAEALAAQGLPVPPTTSSPASPTSSSFSQNNGPRGGVPRRPSAGRPGPGGPGGGRGAAPGGPGGPGGPGPRRRSSQDVHPAGGSRSSSAKQQPVVSADGFEGVSKGSRAAPNQAKERPQAGPKKDSTTRQGFSFAAAAGLMEEVGDDEEGKANGNGDVEEVTNGVKEVSV